MKVQANLSRTARRRAVTLYRRLRSVHAGIRHSARENLTEFGADVVPFLMRLIRRENSLRLIARSLAVLLLGAALLLLIADMLKSATPPFDAWVTGLVLWGMIMGIVFYPPASRQHKEVLAVFARLEDPRAVGLLIEALGLRHFEDTDVRRLAVEALTDRLPRMTREEYAALTSQQRHLLRRELQGERAALVLAVLALLHDHGGPTDLAWVRPLADGGGTACAADVAEAARKCMRRIQERVKQEKDVQELLRMPRGGVYSSENLLRAAAGILPPE